MNNQVAELPHRAEVLAELGVSADRVRFSPWPATEADLLALDNQNVLCELIDGVLVEKPMGAREALLAMWIGTLLNNHVRPRNLGVVLGPDGMTAISTGSYFLPDVSFYAWAALPGGIPEVAIWPPPTLAVEVLSPGNTPREMERKRVQYFESGVRQVWEVDERTRTITVYWSSSESVIYDASQSIDAAAVIPGLLVNVAEVFGSLDQRPPASGA